MKKVIFIISIFLLITNVHAQVIDRLTFVDEGNMLFEWGSYQSSINRYENRLIVQAGGKIEEFIILSDGTLERIGFHENRNGNLFGIIDNDRFYNMGLLQNGYVFIEVFDLMQTPMRRITGIIGDELSIIPSFFLSEHHMIVTNFWEQRATLINRKTFEIDGYIRGLHYLKGKNNSMLFVTEYIGTTTAINVSEMEYIDNEYVLTEITSIKLENTLARFLTFQDNIMIVKADERCIIMDITDIHNPIELYNIPTNDIVMDAILTDDKIFISLANGSLVVYDRDGQGGFTQSFYESGLHSWQLTWVNNMYLHGQFLYINNGLGLRVYDVNNNFEEVFSHGVLDFSTLLQIYRPNDFYIVKHWFENDLEIDRIRIYSLIENRLLKSFEVDFELGIVGINIIDDYVYVVYRAFGSKNSNGSFVGVYQKSEMELHHLNTVFISSSSVSNPFIHDDLIYMRFSHPDRVEVYRVNGQEVNRVHSFNGRITFPIQPQSSDVILNWNNRSVHFRDINNPSDIIFSATLRQGTDFVYALSDNIFTVHQIQRTSDIDSWMDMYEFCINGRYIRFLTRYIGRYEPINHGVLLSFSHFTGNSTFYSVINGSLTQIGYLEGERNVQETNFYKESKKLIQIAGSGIWVYSVDFNVIVSEDDEVVPVAQTGLLSNFPNPFNPSTTIRFEVEGSRFVNIEVFNIRGQRVRTLLDGSLEFGAGRHSVEWDGTDDGGRSVGSGVYLYRMTAGEYSATKRMVLMK